MEVQVRLGAAARAPAEPDLLPAPHLLADLDGDAARHQVAQARELAVRVLDEHVVAADVSPAEVHLAVEPDRRIRARCARFDHHAVGRRENGQTVAIVRGGVGRIGVGVAAAPFVIEYHKVVGIALGEHVPRMRRLLDDAAVDHRPRALERQRVLLPRGPGALVGLLPAVAHGHDHEAAGLLDRLHEELGFLAHDAPFPDCATAAGRRRSCSGSRTSPPGTREGPAQPGSRRSSAPGSPPWCGRAR